MWWLNRVRNVWCTLLQLGACAPLLTGCGFQPLYSKTSEANSKLTAGVKIDSIPGRAGQEFKADLEDRLNPPSGVANPAYRLTVTLNTSETAIGVARDNTVSRYNMYLNSHYTLYRIADDKPITSGDLTYVNSYNNLTNAYFSTYISEGDAEKRGVAELSELYRQRLGAYLEAGAPVQDVPKSSTTPAKPPIGPIILSPDPTKNNAYTGPGFK